MLMFTHDCAACSYLGQGARHPYNAVDVYRHGGTLIARYGDDGPDYLSGPWSLDAEKRLLMGEK